VFSNRPSRTLRIFTYTILILWAFFCLAPLYWIFSTAFKPPAEAEAYPPTFIPRSITLENFVYIFTKSRNFGVMPFLNSFIYASGTALLTVGICSLSGYALSRYRFPGRRWIGVAMFFLNMLPALSKLIALYIMYSRLGLYDTRIGLILLYTAGQVAFGTWVMKGYFDSIPLDLEEAARVDGASPWQCLLYVTLPLSLPGMGAVAVNAFSSGWDEFMLALTLTQSKELRPYTVALSALVGEYGRVAWHHVSAAGVVSLLPIVLLFVIFQRAFVAGLSAGGTK